MLIIGSMFLGKVKKMNDQWVESKFVIIGIPLFPTSSMLVTSSSHNRRQGIPIPLHTTSIAAAYMRVFLGLIAGGCLVAGSVTDNSLALLAGLLFAAAWAYAFFRFGKTEGPEVAIRNKIGKATGLYVAPHWLDFDMTMRILKDTQYTYDNSYPNENWKTALKEYNIPAEKQALLYTLALFNYRIDPSTENELLYTRADNIFQV